MNEGIRKVRQSGEYDRIYDKWFGKKVFAGYSEKEIWFFGFIAVLLSLALGISIGLFILNLRLRRSKNELSKALTERERAEETLRESEQRLSIHLENSPLATVEWDSNFIVTRWAGEAEKMFGWSRAETIGKPIMDLHMICDEDIPIVQKTMERLTDGVSKHVVSANRNYTRDGKVIYCEWYNSVVLNPQGKMVSVLSQVLDITARKQAEEALRESEAHYHSLVEGIPGIVYSFSDRRGGIYYSSHVEDILGYSREHLYAHPMLWHDSIHPDDLPRVEETIRQLPIGKVFHIEYRIRDAQGNWRWFDDRLIERHSNSGEEIVTGLALDITERKQAESALRKSEAMLNETQRLTKVGGWEYDIEKNKITWTDEVYRIYGVSPQNYDPNNITQDIQFYAPEERATIERAFNAAIKEGKPYDLQLKFTTAHGKKLWVRTIGQVEKKGGKAARVYGYIMDITEIKAAEDALHKLAEQLEDRVEERKGELSQSQKALMNMVEELNKAMQALRESEERYRMLVESSPDGIMVHDTEKFTYVNKAASDILGASEPEELIGKTVLEIIHPDYRETVKKRLQMEKEGKEAPLIEQKFLKMDGTPIDVDVMAFPIKHEDRIEVHSVIRDITERKKAVDAIKAANLRLMELDRMKSMFIASTSHELRTPLNSIIGFSSVMLEGWSGELTSEQKEQLQLIHNSGQQLLALINDVIDISKTEAGKLEVYVSEFRLKEVVDEAVATLRTNIKEKGLALSVDVPDIIMHTDRRRLLQCILNYLSNAAKFTEKGSIALTAKDINDRIDISVTDTGIGIKEEDIAKLFVPFVRLESPFSVQAGGSGLGLYLTKKIVEETLGGTVAVKSKYDKGSTFSLHIPVKLKVNT